LKFLCEKRKKTNYCEGHVKLKSETKFRKILHCAIKMTALKVYLPPLLLYNEWQLLNYFNHDILCICQNQNNNKNFPYFFLLEFQIIIIMQLSTTKIRKHEITKQRISLLSKTLLYSLNKNKTKKSKHITWFFYDELFGGQNIRLQYQSTFLSLNYWTLTHNESE